MNRLLTNLPPQLPDHLFFCAQTSPFRMRTSRAILQISHSEQQKIIRASLIIVPCSLKKKNTAWFTTREAHPAPLNKETRCSEVSQ